MKKTVKLFLLIINISSILTMGTILLLGKEKQVYDIIFIVAGSIFAVSALVLYKISERIRLLIKSFFKTWI